MSGEFNFNSYLSNIVFTLHETEINCMDFLAKENRWAEGGVMYEMA